MFTLNFKATSCNFSAFPCLTFVNNRTREVKRNFRDQVAVSINNEVERSRTLSF